MKKVWPICSWTPNWRQQILDWDEFDTFPPQCVKDFLQFYDFPAPLLCFTCLWTGKRQLKSRRCWWWFTNQPFHLLWDRLITNYADDMSYKPICSRVFVPETNNESWWWLMDFFSDEVDDGSISLNLRSSGDLQFTTLIMSSLMICFAITTTRILSSLLFSLDCSVQGEHTHFWREREDGQFDSEAGKTWPGWVVKHFKARLILLIWQRFERKLSWRTLSWGYVSGKGNFLSKQAQCFQIPGTDRLFFMK